MSGGQLDTAVHGRTERSASAWAADAATAVFLIALALALAITLLLVLKVGYLASLAGTVLLVAAVLFGPTHGLLAAAAAVIAYRLHAHRPTSALDAQTLEVLLVIVAALAIPWSGRYITEARRERRAAGNPPEVRRVDFVQLRETIAEFARRRTFGFNWRLTLGAARFGFVPFVILGAATIAGVLLHGAVGPEASVQVLLIGVLCVAAAFGAQYGFAAGILGAVLLSGVVVSGPTAALARPLGTLLTLIVFSATGWGVGALADQLQRKRSALDVLVRASREISTTTDEAVIHQVLFDSLRRLTGRNWVETRDDSGAIRLTSPAADAPTGGVHSEDVADGWRSRPLAADGRAVGQVRWRYLGLKTDVDIADEIAASLVDLGASAIVRARLSVEKSEMEFVARSEHLRTILLDAVSHHFRSPLAGILGSVTSVLNLPDQHDRQVRRELLLIIKEQANRLSRYVDNFLSVARLESGSIEVNLTEVHLEPLIYDVWETFGEAGGARRFLQVQVDPQPIRADPSLLAQVLGNVLENAIKFSPEESIVDVRSRRQGDKLVLEVTDQGVGVQDGNEDHIFRRFFRSPGAKAPGLGLGLYITRSLVEMQGGSVEARNRDDRETGLRVSLVLPVVGRAA
jgi:two-component system sensor histidine kinase KdpD